MAEATETRLGSAPHYGTLVPRFSPYTASPVAAVRLAWRVMLVAVVALVVLIVGGPLVRGWYVNSAIEPRPADLMSIDGVVFIRHQGSRDWSTAGPDARVAPGDTLRTAANARAFVQFFDQSTVLLYPSSTLRVLRAEQGRFRADKATVVMELSNGRARVGVAPHQEGAGSFFQVRTPHAEVHLEEGSYSLDVGRDASQVRVRRGQAAAHALQPTVGPGSVLAGSAGARDGQRLVIRPDRAPQGSLPLRADLLENGWLNEKAGSELAAWKQLDLSQQEPGGTVALEGGLGAVVFRRQGRGHGETLITQHLDVDLWDYERLVLSADFRVLSHSLSGGGWQGTEYPLMLRVIYRDATGGKQPWYRGFYLHNRDDYPTAEAQPLASTDWQHVDLDLLGLVPRPWKIERVEVVASGWDYVSAVREVHLWAE